MPLATSAADPRSIADMSKVRCARELLQRYANVSAEHSKRRGAVQARSESGKFVSSRLSAFDSLPAEHAETCSAKCTLTPAGIACGGQNTDECVRGRAEQPIYLGEHCLGCDPYCVRDLLPDSHCKHRWMISRCRGPNVTLQETSPTAVSITPSSANLLQQLSGL